LAEVEAGLARGFGQYPGIHRLFDNHNQVGSSDSLFRRPFGKEDGPDSRLEVSRVTFDVETECDCIVEVALG